MFEILTCSRLAGATVNNQYWVFWNAGQNVGRYALRDRQSGL